MGSGDVGDEDLLDGELVLGEEEEDAGDVVAGVNDDGFAGLLVAEDGAVALEGSDGEDFVNHGSLRVMARWNCSTWIYTDDTDLRRVLSKGMCGFKQRCAGLS